MKRAVALYSLFILVILISGGYFIHSFISESNNKYEMLAIRVHINEYDKWNGRNEDISFFVEEYSGMLTVSSAWYGNFNEKAFLKDFEKGKEYTAHINSEDLASFEAGEDALVYGLASEQKTYLHSQDAIKKDKNNSWFLLIFGIIFIAAAVFLLVVLVGMLTGDRRTAYKVDKRIYKK